MSYKQISLSERIIIESGLNENLSICQIADNINRSTSSISREIKRNRYASNEPTYRRIPCVHKDACELKHNCGDIKCNTLCYLCTDGCGSGKCDDYSPVKCERLYRAPYVCNGCSKALSCRNEKYRYSAGYADKLYRQKQIDTREGVSFSPEEMKHLDELFSPLLLNGQSIASIYMTHKEEISCCMKTAYNLIDGNYLTARNLDLPRKVKYKKRYKRINPNGTDTTFAVERTYQDYLKFMLEHPDFNVVQMDTVIGRPGGKTLLTLFFTNCSFMIAILLESKRLGAVIEALNHISNLITIESFQNMFPVILTDRGTEFSNPYALECDENGEIKTHLFYCDAYHSAEKGAIEKNHEFIRCILPSGTSFDQLTQDDVNLMMNHINNYPRKKLNGKTPYEMASMLLDPALLKYVHAKRILPDNVILKPKLLRKGYFEK